VEGLTAPAGTLAVGALANVRALGKNETRVDGADKVSGKAKYSADFAMDGMLWAAFVRSPVPHARIVGVDKRAALAVPGVRCVLAGADIGERHFGRQLMDWPVLAYDRVRFVGDSVAAIAADTREAAVEAALLVDVTYEELPSLLDAASALAPDAERVHEEPSRYRYAGGTRPSVPHSNMQGYDVVELGDVAAAFDTSARIFEHTFTTPRYFGGYLEPRATLVWFDENDVCHVVTTNKSPFLLRQQIANTTGHPLEKVIVESSYIGGDFGSKGASVEEFQCFFLARATGRPVKCVRGYADDIRATNVRHAATIRLRTGVDAGGKFVAFDASAVYDGGAYAAAKPIPDLIPGLRVRTPYYFPNSRVERISVYTHSVPGGHVRAPADVQFSFALESHVDAIARELGVDPLEFRLQNAIRSEDRDVSGSGYFESRAADVLEGLRTELSWSGHLPRGRGRGISLTSRHVGIGKTRLRLSLDADGSVGIVTGTTEQGSGTVTVVARVVATVLDIDPAFVRVLRGNTDSALFDPGVGGSRVTHVLGRAAYNAASELRVRLEAVGYPYVPWNRAVTELLAGGSVDIEGTYGYEEHESKEWHNFSAYGVELSVDLETGQVTIHDVVFVMDVGVIINPLSHRGQIDGGFSFGIGHALSEELVLEEGKIVNLNLGDYKLPTMRDMPPLRVVYVPTDAGPGPFGAKMAGEVSTSGVAPAIANAIADATGARLAALPLTSERIAAALERMSCA
jgi:CO/xanthine dehydrogenase Mo-binding subunit